MSRPLTPSLLAHCGLQSLALLEHVVQKGATLWLETMVLCCCQTYPRPHQEEVGSVPPQEIGVILGQYSILGIYGYEVGIVEKNMKTSI